MIDKSVVAPQPQAAAILPSPLGILYQLIAVNPQRVVDFDFLNRRVLGVLTVALHGVRPVLGAAPPIAAGHGLVVGIKLPRARVGAAEADLAHRSLGRGRDLIGQRRMQSLENDIGEPHLGLPAPDHRRGCRAIDDRSLGGHEPHLLVEAGVDRHVLVDQALEYVRAGRKGLGVRGIDRCPALRIAPRQVEEHSLVVDGDADLEPHRLVGKAVVIDDACGTELPLGQLGQFG